MHRVSESGRVPNIKLTSSSPHGVRTHYPPGTRMGDSMKRSANQGSSPELQRPDFSLVFHYVGMTDHWPQGLAHSLPHLPSLETELVLSGLKPQALRRESFIFQVAGIWIEPLSFTPALASRVLAVLAAGGRACIRLQPFKCHDKCLTWLTLFNLQNSSINITIPTL